jgi:hypothetical protein
MITQHPVLSILMILMVLFATLPWFNKFFPVWACKKLGWHRAPVKQGFDGASFTGTCPRCGKSVLQDSQGNWF